ncbi:nucleotidyltransferase domain-containing protein [Patescibacteria group bacterium]|nr:nucleotidyltransferase domain-containing protein [Patescibacteria group bacterium]MBU2260167.1 nucleotidyltransferase domain-containing protein [Patescibacteria group bacterium]
MKKEDGLRITRTFRDALKAEGLPVQRVLLYGSVARDAAVEDSDLDIAVVCMPFKETRHEENMELRRIRWDIDTRISPYTFHPEDFQNKFFSLAHEIERTGVEV